MNNNENLNNEIISDFDHLYCYDCFPCSKLLLCIQLKECDWFYPYHENIGELIHKEYGDEYGIIGLKRVYTAFSMPIIESKRYKKHNV